MYQNNHCEHCNACQYTRPWYNKIKSRRHVYIFATYQYTKQWDDQQVDGGCWKETTLESTHNQNKTESYLDTPIIFRVHNSQPSMATINISARVEAKVVERKSHFHICFQSSSESAKYPTMARIIWPTRCPMDKKTQMRGVTKRLDSLYAR